MEPVTPVINLESKPIRQSNFVQSPVVILPPEAPKPKPPPEPMKTTRNITDDPLSGFI